MTASLTPRSNTTGAFASSTLAPAPTQAARTGTAIALADAASKHTDALATSLSAQLGSKTADPLAMYINDVCTVPMSLAGIPGISIPNALSEGLPVGFQIAGPAFSENRLLEAAYALEQAIGFDGSGALS